MDDLREEEAMAAVRAKTEAAIDMESSLAEKIERIILDAIICFLLIIFCSSLYQVIMETSK